MTNETLNGETVADRHVHPATVPIRFLADAPRTLLGLPAAYAVFSRGDMRASLAVAAIVALIALLAYAIAYRRFRYGVGAAELVIESGLLTRTRRVIPFDRVQDVDIERGPTQRLFGLATVRVETGGAAKDEGTIDSVTLAEAERLRAAIRTGKVAAAPGIAEAPAARTVFAMTLPRVLLAGLFNFSLLYLAGLFGALQTFRNLLPFDIYDSGRWIGLVDDRLGGRFGPAAILAVLLVAGVIGILFGVARTLLADYGFQVTAEGQRLRRTRGLLTRSDVVLPKHRVQLALRQTGPVRDALGWSELHFQTLGGRAGGGAAGDAGGRQPVAPLARQAEVAAVLAEQGRLRLPEPDALELVSGRHVVRALLRRVLAPAILILAAAIFWRPALWGLFALPVLALGALVSRRFHRWGLADGLLFVRRGVWQRQLWIVPAERVQNLALTRSWLQRRLGLATLLVDTAGGSAVSAPAVVDLRLARARELLDALRRARLSYSGRNSGTDR